MSKDWWRNANMRGTLAFILVTTYCLMWAIVILDQVSPNLINSVFNLKMNSATENSTGLQDVMAGIIGTMTVLVTITIQFYFRRSGSPEKDEGDIAMRILESTMPNKRPEEKEKTISELLENYEGELKPQSARITDTVSAIKNKFSDNSNNNDNILITDQDNKPLGVLYLQDFDSYIIEPGEDNQEVLGSRLVEHVARIEKDVLGKAWTENGANNFATVKLHNTVKEIKKTMRGISQNNNDVKAILVDHHGKVDSIISFETLSNFE